MNGEILILACSPRKSGNSDTAAAAVAGILEAGQRVTALRDHTVLPCVSCGYCSRHPGGPCPFMTKDDSGPLFAALERASALVLVSPIYFYHLPAQLKALVDRSQPWWTLRAAQGLPSGGNPAPDGKRVAYPILVAARPRGEQLFEGSLLTMKYWLPCFGYSLAEPLTLYGLDAAGALSGSPRAMERVREYAGRIRTAMPAGE